MKLSCFWCARFREIMMEAPWSSFDLAMSVILILLGMYLIAGFTWLESAYSLYQPLSGWLSLWTYGWVCWCAGIIQAWVVLWHTRPPFELRLLARMGVCFCMVMLGINQISNVPPPVGAVTHLILALLSIWSVLRTRQSGG